MKTQLLLALAFVALALAAVPPAAAFEECAGLSSGSTCTGVYTNCPAPPGGPCNIDRIYVCAGIYDGACTGVQKP